MKAIFIPDPRVPHSGFGTAGVGVTLLAFESAGVCRASEPLAITRGWTHGSWSLAEGILRITLPRPLGIANPAVEKLSRGMVTELAIVGSPTSDHPVMATKFLDPRDARSPTPSLSAAAFGIFLTLGTEQPGDIFSTLKFGDPDPLVPITRCTFIRNSLRGERCLFTTAKVEREVSAEYQGQSIVWTLGSFVANLQRNPDDGVFRGTAGHRGLRRTKGLRAATVTMAVLGGIGRLPTTTDPASARTAKPVEDALRAQVGGKLQSLLQRTEINEVSRSAARPPAQLAKTRSSAAPATSVSTMPIRHPWSCDLSASEFVYREKRRTEDQSGLRADFMPPYPSQLFSYSAIVDDRGKEVLPWQAGGSQNLVVAPSGREIALLEGHPLGGPWLIANDWPRGAPYKTAPLMSSLPGFHVLANRGSSVCGIEYSPNGQLIACLEWAGCGVLTLLNALNGQRAFVTTLNNVGGYEQPLWSSDGRWLLLSTHPEPQLVSLEEGTVIPLPLKGMQVDWWPTEGPSTLLVLGGTAPSHWIGRFDLATNTLQQISPVEVPVQDGLDAWRHRLSYPRVSPDGRRVLVGSCLGPDSAYQREHGSWDRVAVVNVATGSIHHVTTPFADEARWVERCHERWRWTVVGRADGRTQVSSALRAAANPLTGPDPCATYDFADRWESVVILRW